MGAGKTELALLDAGRDSLAPIARLQVKLEGGQRVCLSMEPHATLGNLSDALARWRADNCVPLGGANGKQPVLRTAFPPRAYTDLSQTLQDAGLSPTATLFVSVEQPA